MTRPTRHKLLKHPTKRCKCGKYFNPANHNRIYCSIKCLSIHSCLNRWTKNRTLFNQEHPELCPNCGINTSKKKFRACEDCRRKIRNRPSYKKRLKSNLTLSPHTTFNKG